MCKGAVRIVCDSPNRTCPPLSDEPEPRENARVLTLPGCRHLSKPSRRRCVRRSARLPGKAARSAAAQTLRFPTFADIRSGCTGRGTDRLRAAAFFDGKKTPIHRDRPARRTADSLHSRPAILSGSFSEKKVRTEFSAEGRGRGDRPKRRASAREASRGGSRLRRLAPAGRDGTDAPIFGRRAESAPDPRYFPAEGDKFGIFPLTLPERNSTVRLVNYYYFYHFSKTWE